MASGVTIGYVNFTILIFLLTGGILLRIDVKGYEQKGMNKERKAARIMGWMNISLGIVTLISNWIYQTMM